MSAILSGLIGGEWTMNAWATQKQTLMGKLNYLHSAYQHTIILISYSLGDSSTNIMQAVDFGRALPVKKLKNLCNS